MTKLTTLVLTSACALTITNNSFGMEESLNQKPGKKIHRKETRENVIQLLKENNRLSQENNELLRSLMVQNHLLNRLTYYQSSRYHHNKDTAIMCHCTEKEDEINNQLLSLYQKHTFTSETVLSNSSSDKDSSL